MIHLITGGSGFVGSAIARTLVARGERVRVLDLWKSDQLPATVEFIHGDVTDQNAIAVAMRDVAFVYHNAALVPLAKAKERFWQVNVEGTRLMLAAAREARVRMFSHMSSTAVYGSPSQMPITSDFQRCPIEIFGESKKAAEDLVFAEHERGLPTSIIRPRAILGEGRLGIFGILFQWIRDGANIYIIGPGDNLFQFVHIDDVVEAAVRASLKQVTGAFNVGAQEFSTLRDDLEFLCRHAATGSRVRSLPVALAKNTLRVLDLAGLCPLSPWHYLTYHRPFYFDGSAYDRLGFRPRFSNRAALTQTYNWFLKTSPDSVRTGSSPHTGHVKQGVLNLLKALS
jgi:nucleoside-diphosphate-sugar epimerase